MTQPLLGNYISTDPLPVDPRNPQIIFFRSVDISGFDLISQIKSARVPLGTIPPSWEDLMTGLVILLQEVVYMQRFEPFQAKIYKDSWLAAEAEVFLQPVKALRALYPVHPRLLQKNAAPK